MSREELQEDWTQRFKVAPDDGAAYDQFVQSVSIDGNRIVVGAALADDAGGNTARPRPSR